MRARPVRRAGPLLPQTGRLSASRLDRELEVATRTALRDIDVLAAARVPVYAAPPLQQSAADTAGSARAMRTGMTPPASPPISNDA